jgi:uncharacterized protein YoxC
MQKVTDLRQVFRKINDALQSLYGMELKEKNKTIQALVSINEKLADETETLLKKAIKFKKDVSKTE